MKSTALKAFPRTQSGTSGVKKLRAAGRVPAVVYGKKTDPKNVEVDAKELETIISHSANENLVVDLSIDQDSGGSRLAVVQEIQHNPVSGALLHLDLHEVDESEAVEIQVPLETKGEAVGVKQSGGMLEHVMFKVRVKALPRDLPEVIHVDVTELQAGHAIHLGEVKAPEKVEILGDADLVVVSIAEPRKAKTEEPEAAAEEKADEGAKAEENKS